MAVSGIGLTLDDLGMDLGEDVAGVPAWQVRARGICICGHRVAAHRGANGRCFGVPQGNRLHIHQSDVECACALMVPIMLVPDARPFRATWKSAAPVHPFTYGLLKLGVGRVETWLVDVPFVCMQCGQVGGVRPAYAPGQHRRFSGLLCDLCAPEENAS